MITLGNLSKWNFVHGTELSDPLTFCKETCSVYDFETMPAGRRVGLYNEENISRNLSFIWVSDILYWHSFLEAKIHCPSVPMIQTPWRMGYISSQNKTHTDMFGIFAFYSQEKFLSYWSETTNVSSSLSYLPSLVEQGISQWKENCICDVLSHWLKPSSTKGKIKPWASAMICIQHFLRVIQVIIFPCNRSWNKICWVVW